MGKTATEGADGLTRDSGRRTGTGLGDPVEAGSLSAVMLKDRPDSAGVFAVGSSKANVGHAETAAGMTGLLRIALSLSHCMAMPNAPTLWKRYAPVRKVSMAPQRNHHNARGASLAIASDLALASASLKYSV